MVFPSFGVDMFFLSLRVCGSIEGPIWRTQIQSVNAREVEKNLWDFLGCLSIFFGIFWRIASLSVSLGQLWPNVSQSIWHVFPSNAIIYFRSRWNRHIPTVDGFLRSLREKPWSWTFDYKNISLLVMRHMTVRNTKVTYWHLGSQVYIYIRIYILYYIYIHIWKCYCMCIYHDALLPGFPFGKWTHEDEAGGDQTWQAGKSTTNYVSVSFAGKITMFNG